jgi:uncharacterized protein
VKVQPRVRKAAIRGTVPSADGPRLGMSVVEAAEDGRANRAVCTAIADELGVPPSSVVVAQGATSREKVLRVAGDPAALAGRLKELGL